MRSSLYSDFREDFLPRPDEADWPAAPPPAGLEARIGRRRHLRGRLEREAAHARRVRTLRAGFFHVESWYSAHAIIRGCLRLTGLYARARRNARALQRREHEIPLKGLPRALDGYAVLHISDPHADFSPEFPDLLIDRIRGLDFDLCVLTGDYRTRTFGPYAPALDALARVRPHLKERVYAVLGNHDSIRMVPGLEAMGIRVLLNESVPLEHEGAVLYLAGIDDAHGYRLHDLQKAAAAIPPGAAAVLLSHTPEVYREAAQAGFALMLCGHTHGGQICLPGGFPLITDADCPRRFAKGAWRYGSLAGYTSPGSGSSIVDLRLNCPPEVTLHRLRAE